MTVENGGAYSDLPTPLRTGFEFNGWFTSLCGGTRITNSSVVNLNGNQTLFARWQVKQTPEPTQPPVQRPNASNSPYRDVSPGDWYYHAVMYVYEKGLMIGMDDGRFAPFDTLTREQAILIIARLSGDDYMKYAGQYAFDDVAANRWSAAAIAWARATGVTAGVGGNKFDPTSLVTYDQFEVMLMRHFGLRERWNGNSSACSRAEASWLLYEYAA